MTALKTTMFSVALIVALTLLQGCGGGGGGGGGGGDAAEDSNDLVLVDVNVEGTDGVALNTIIEITVSEALDPDSVRPETVQVRQGPNYGLQVPGAFRIDGNRIQFSPRLPVEKDYTDGGFQPGTGYRIILPGAPKVATLRSFTGNRLVREFEADFSTATLDDGAFIDNFLDPGPPKVLSVNPVDNAVEVPADTDVTIVFNRRPLDPATISSDTVSVRLLERDGVVLDRPVEGTPVLEQSRESVRITWKPRFPLASRAEYSLTVSRLASDLVGFDLERFESTFSTRDEAPRPGEFVLEFTSDEFDPIVDKDVTTASWGTETPGELSALFTAAGGDGTAGDFTPKTDVEISAEDFTKGVTTLKIDGVDVDVFNFRSIEIPDGVTVRILPRPNGPNRPVMLVALKGIKIDGTLTASGGRGNDTENDNYFSSNTLPAADGGAAGPGGGDGANRYSGTSNRNHPIANGGSVANGGGGGGGGRTSSNFSYSYSSGAGGGGSRTRGKVGNRARPGFTSSFYATVAGTFGQSVTDRGLALNLERRPNVGGGGGGAGANGYYIGTRSRNGAGTGGGGGGGLTIQSAADVEIGPNGKIDLSGGNGGNIMRNMCCYHGGAGGGGAGGSALIRATNRVIFGVGATLDVSGGTGGIYNSFSIAGGQGGDGGEGYIRLEAKLDESTNQPQIEGTGPANLTYRPVSTGEFAPRGAGAPSIAQTKWVNLGVFDPSMVKPAASDTDAELFNDTLTVEVQMAVEHPQKLGEPDLSAMDLLDLDNDGERDDSRDERLLSEWTLLRDIEDLNGVGFSFVRIRFVFQLDENQGPDDPLPTVKRVRLPYEF